MLDAFYKKVRDMIGSRKNFLLCDYVKYMDILKNHSILTKKKYVDHAPGVRLMTAHKSKGLEFNYVIIAHATDGVWGNRTPRNLFSIPVIEHARDQGRIDDERRLFYVALTRAREGVIITYANNDTGGTLNPSQFLMEIDQSFVKREKVETELKFDEQIIEHKEKPAKSLLLIDPKFVSKIFLEQSLSVTHLNNFITCPWKYFFTNLIRIPQSEEKHQLYGTAIHATLKSYFDLYKQERDIDTKKALEIFVHELDKLPLGINDREDSIKKGKKALTSYIKNYYPNWNRNIITEYGITILIQNPSLKLTGKLDKVEIIGDGIVNVVDYKTGKPKSRNEIEGKTKNSDGNYARQLAFYKLLIDTDGKFYMKSGELDFIEPNERGIHKKESFEINDENVKNLLEEIEKMYKSVTTMSFVGKSCDDDSCEHCRLARIITR
jgi:DNA helicase-2/ATP-dependent DNA helicase PcrA